MTGSLPFSSKLKQMTSIYPSRLNIVFVLLSFLSLSLLLHCGRSSSDNQPSSSSSSAPSAGEESDVNVSEAHGNRARGFEQGLSNIQDKRTFKLTHDYTIGPVDEHAEKLRAWLAIPLENRHQTVHEISIEAGPLAYDITKDPQHGNRFLYIEISNPSGTYDVTVNSRVTRHSIREPYRSTRPNNTKTHYLRETSGVPVHEKMKKLALEQGAGGTDRETIRNLFNFVIDHATYNKANPTKYQSSGSERVDATYVLEQRQGGCADLNALFVSLARSVKIPTRSVFGAFLPAKFDGKDHGAIDHCWTEAHLDGEGWLSLDVSFADLWPDLRDVYFGGLDARRVVFSRGRGIQLVPESDTPVRYFINGHVELDRKEYDNWTRKRTFEEIR